MIKEEYFKLAEIMLNETKNNNIHWRKGLSEMLEGEAFWLLSNSGVYVSRNNAEIATKIMKIVAENPDSFYVSGAEKPGYSPCLVSKLFFERFKNNSGRNTVINSEMKRWLRCSDDVVLFKFLPSMIRFYIRAVNARIPLEELLSFVYSWRFKKKDLIYQVGRDLYYLSNGSNKASV